MSIVQAWFVQQIQQSGRRRRARKPAGAGWYYDPRKQARYRYWSGSRWTDETADTIPG